MNSCILITSHADNFAKEKSALKLIDFLKDKSLPIIYVDNYKVPSSVQEKVDWALFSKENPKLNRLSWAWKLANKTSGPELGLSNPCFFSGNLDYGYAHLLQTYRGFKFAESLGYDHVIHFNYDLVIDNQNWERLIKQIKLTPNVVFKWGQDFCATNIYTFLIKDFIKIADENFHYYKNTNFPSTLPHDWVTETAFTWMLKNSQINYHYENSIKVSSERGSKDIYCKHGLITPYFYKGKNSWLIEFQTPPLGITSLEFKVNGQILVANLLKSSPNLNYFLIPHIKGRYYLGDDFLFDTETFKETQVLTNYEDLGEVIEEILSNI